MQKLRTRNNVECIWVDYCYLQIRKTICIIICSFLSSFLSICPLFQIFQFNINFCYIYRVNLVIWFHVIRKLLTVRKNISNKSYMIFQQVSTLIVFIITLPFYRDTNVTFNFLNVMPNIFSWNQMKHWILRKRGIIQNCSYSRDILKLIILC